MIDQKLFNAIAQYLKKYIMNPVVIQAELQGKRLIVGRFKSGASTFDFSLTPKGVSYKPIPLVNRNDSVFGKPTGQYKCTAGKSYQCGKICLTVHNRCKKNENNEADIRRLASIFAYANSGNANEAKVETLRGKALKGLEKEVTAKIESLAKKLVAQPERSKLAQKKREERASKRSKVELPEKHVITGNPRYNNDSIANALNSLGDKEQVKAFTDILAKQEIQAIFNDGSVNDSKLFYGLKVAPSAKVNLAKAINNTKIKYNNLLKEGKKAEAAELRKAIATAEQSLTKDYIAVIKGAGGYTSRGFNHVTLNTQKTDKPFVVTPEAIKQTLDTVYKNAEGGNSSFTVSSAARFNKDADTSDFTDYLHELGHQMDYLACHALGVDALKIPKGVKSATKYSTKTQGEWFAEHFVLWMADKKRYEKFDPIGAKFIESTFNLARSASRRKK